MDESPEMHISRPLQAEPPYDLNFTPQVLRSIKKKIKRIAGCSLKYRDDNNISTAERHEIYS